MRKEKFVFNTKTLRYEKVMEPIKAQVLRFFIFAIIVVGLILIKINGFIDRFKPNDLVMTEYYLKSTLDSLRKEIDYHQHLLMQTQSYIQNIKEKSIEREELLLYIERQKDVLSLLNNEILEKEQILSNINKEISSNTKLILPDTDNDWLFHLKKYYYYYLLGTGLTLLFLLIYRKRLKEWYERNFLKLIGNYTPKYSMTFDLPNELRAPLQQYIIFFKEFVWISKGYNVAFVVENIENGIKIEFTGNKNEWEDKIRI